MTDFKVEFENRFYTTFLESSEVTPERVEVKVIMYGTVYAIWKDKNTGKWNNHISKFELSLGLLKAVGEKLDELLKL
ncbi:hypothetical protein [Desertivirga arenae]|uniref:hypothetical protein n=1 Tax=Desertivirga arenae TaxID=2810309 RepID=UPI001A9720E5|nr:hypothetical protein [Pedobacter sp. SYSU D00823]